MKRPRLALRFAMSALLAMALLPALAGAAEPAKPAARLSAEERLDAIRHGLVQAALEGATRVESVAWLDTDGRLHESSSFRSGMQVRGVQVLAYVRDPDGQPRARLKMPQAGPSSPAASPAQRDLYKETLISKAAPTSSAPPTAPNCPAQGGLSHLIGLETAVTGRWPVQDAPLAQALADTVNAAWLQASTANSANWRVLPEADGTIKTPDDAPRSAYEQALLGTAAAGAWPWQMQVVVQPGPPVAPQTSALLQGWQSLVGLPAAPQGVARISLSLVSGQGQGQGPAPALSLSADIPLLREPSQWGAPQFSPAGGAQVQALMARWRLALSAHLACEVVRPYTVLMPNGALRLNVGGLAGVQAGDEWLLADPAVFPQRLLSPGVAQQLVLAKVQKVHARHADLQLIAGPARPVQSGWRAWRAESPVAE